MKIFAETERLILREILLPYAVHQTNLNPCRTTTCKGFLFSTGSITGKNIILINPLISFTAITPPFKSVIWLKVKKVIKFSG